MLIDLGVWGQCFVDFCAQNAFLNENSDVFLGYIAWAAGSFSTSYILSLTPTEENGKFVDNALCSQCVVAPWLSAGTAIVTSAVVIASSTSAGAVATSTGEAGVGGGSVTSTNSKVGLGGSATGSGSTATASQSLTTTSSGRTTTASQTSTSLAPATFTNGADMIGLLGGLLFAGAFAIVVFL